MHVEGSVAAIIEDRPITTSPLQHMPYAEKNYRLYFPLFPAFAEMTKAGDCDLAISTSQFAKSMVSRKQGKPKHICYIHSPMRYIWDRFEATRTEESGQSSIPIGVSSDCGRAAAV